MTIQYCLSPVTEEYEKYLTGVGKKPKYALWLRSVDWDFEASDLKELLKAFEPLQGIVWCASSVKEDLKSSSIDSLPEIWQGLLKETISISMLDFMGFRPSILTKVGWLANSANNVFVEYLKRKSMQSQGVISFIACDRFQAINWTKSVC